MTERQLQKRVDYWAKRLRPLGLGHWDFNVNVVGEEDMDRTNSDAEVTPSTQYDSARIEFKDSSYILMDQDTLDWTIIHELLHVVFRDYDSIVHLVTQELGATAKELAEHQIEHEMEGVIERLARTIFILSKESC